VRLLPCRTDGTKGLCTKQDLYDIIGEFRKKSPRGRIPRDRVPVARYLLSQTENKVIDDILAVPNTHGMDSKQSLELLEQVGQII